MIPMGFLIPGNIDLPTGGYAYDRRVLALLGGHGIAAEHVILPEGYPAPSARDLAVTAQRVSALSARHVLLIDGLALGAMPEDLVQSFGRPMVALCHHPLCLEAGLSPERQAALRQSETAALALADAVVVTSPATRTLLVRDFHVAPQKLVVAIPGTDPAPRALGTGAPLHLLAVGSVVPRKAYPVLIEALAGMRDSDWRLTIAGADDRSPQAVAALQDAIRSHGLADRVTVAGAVDAGRLEQLFAAADLFVLPSLFEGYGMVLAEAMARGLAIVTTTGGAAAETVPDAAALKVAPGDVAALRAALARVIGDGALRETMAKASWIAGRTLPTWEDTARLIAETVKKVHR